jgi:hypothetical protein
MLKLDLHYRSPIRSTDVKKIFFLVLRTLLSTIVSIILSFISGALEGAAHASVLIASIFGFTGSACLAISYLRHRKKCKVLASEALRLSQMPSANPMDWQKLLYQSKQGWKQSPKIWVLLVGIFSWLINMIFSKMIGGDPLNSMAQVSAAVSGMGHFFLQYIEEGREQAEFALSIEAANKGYWFPPAEPPKEEMTAKPKLKDFVNNLPTELLSSAAKGVEERIK